MMSNPGTWTVGLMVLQEGEDEFDVYDKVNAGKFITIPTETVITEDSVSFLADPFLYRYKDTTYLFVETKPFGKKGAYICAFRITDDMKSFTYLGIALKEPFHLSYPQVIEVGNEIFLIPETQGGDSSFVYKSVNFPLEWEKSDFLLPQRIKDPTLVAKDKVSGELFYTKDGKLWKRKYGFDGNKFNLDEQEYVKTGTAFRPGGSPFYVDGKLFLPIQDTSNGYGTNLAVFELKENGELEKAPVKYLLKPNKSIPEFAAGMHHISSIQLNKEKLVAFDGHFLVSEEKGFNPKFFVKYNYLNIWDWIFGSNLEPWYPFNE
jgi:hypothetical protein